MRLPWDQLLAPVDETPPVLTDMVDALRRDFAFAVANTAVVVHSNNPAMKMIANTARGQIVPREQCKFTDGTTVELQDIGMCQPNVPHMTVQEIVARVWGTASLLGLELVK